MARLQFVAIASTLFLLSILSGCSSNTQDEVSALKICKATTATLMGKDVQIMTAEKTKGAGIYHVYYDRPSDNTRWGQLYKFEGNQIIWAGAEEPSNPNFVGRWRTHPLDEKVSFSLANNQLTITITHHDSSKTSKRFTLSDIR